MKLTFRHTLAAERIRTEYAEAMLSDEGWAKLLKEEEGLSLSKSTIRSLRVELGIPSFKNTMQHEAVEAYIEKRCSICDLDCKYSPPPTHCNSKASGFHGELCWNCYLKTAVKAMRASRERGATKETDAAVRARLVSERGTAGANYFYYWQATRSNKK